MCLLPQSTRGNIMKQGQHPLHNLTISTKHECFLPKTGSKHIVITLLEFVRLTTVFRAVEMFLNKCFCRSCNGKDKGVHIQLTR